MSTQSKSSGSPIPGIVVGLLLMFAGTWVSLTYTSESAPEANQLDFIKQLNHQGIPLDPGKTLATIGVLLILFPVIKFFFTNPLGAAIHERTSNLESAFAEAESLRAEMQKMRSDYEQRMAATEANAREQIQTQIREAQNLRTQLMSEATKRADEMVARAQQEIDAEKQKALTELRTHVVDLSLAAAEKVLGENMDYDDPGLFSFDHRSGDILLPKISGEEPLKAEVAHFVQCIAGNGACMTGADHALGVVRILSSAGPA